MQSQVLPPFYIVFSWKFPQLSLQSVLFFAGIRTDTTHKNQNSVMHFIYNAVLLSGVQKVM